MGGFRLLLSSLYYTIVTIIAILLHVAVIEYLPYPFNQINVVFIVLIALLIITVNIRMLWVGLLFGFLLELISSFPFGIIMIALIASSTLVYWILTNVFTHRSIYIVFLTGGIGIVTYRSIILALLILRNFFHAGTFTVEYIVMLQNLIVESAITTSTLTLFYVASRQFIRRLKPEYINRDKIL